MTFKKKEVSSSLPVVLTPNNTVVELTKAAKDLIEIGKKFEQTQIDSIAKTQEALQTYKALVSQFDVASLGAKLTELDDMKFRHTQELKSAETTHKQRLEVLDTDFAAKKRTQEQELAELKVATEAAMNQNIKALEDDKRSLQAMVAEEQTKTEVELANVRRELAVKVAEQKEESLKLLAKNLNFQVLPFSDYGKLTKAQETLDKEKIAYAAEKVTEAVQAVKDELKASQQSLFELQTTTKADLSAKDREITYLKERSAEQGATIQRLTESLGVAASKSTQVIQPNNK